MKKFTIKDFLLYNGPCLNCGEKIIVNVKCLNDKIIMTGSHIIIPSLFSTITDNVIKISLEIKYSYELLLAIYIKSNRYQVSDSNKLNIFLKNNSLILTSLCKKCSCYVETNALKFDTTGLVKPLTISNEFLIISNLKKIYTINSDFNEEKTIIHVYDNNVYNNYDIYHNNNIKNERSLVLNIPLLPLYKFKNKEKLLNKLKMLTVFS